MSLLQALALPKPRNFAPISSGPTPGAGAAPEPKLEPAETRRRDVNSGDTHAQVRADATKLRSAIQAKLKIESDKFEQLVKAKDKLQDLADFAKTPDAKKPWLDKLALVKKKTAEVEKESKELANDLSTIDNAGASPDALVKLMARHGSGATVNKTTEKLDDSLKTNPFEGNKTETTASLKDGTATVKTHQESSSLGLDGLTSKTSNEKEKSNADFTAKTSKEHKANVSLDGKLSIDDTKKDEVELADGRKSSDESGKTKEFSSKGAAWGNSTKSSDFDGSGKETKNKTSIERDDGKLRVGHESSVAKTDAKGTEHGTDKKAGGSLIAGKDGIGGGLDGEAGKSIKSKDGKQVRAALALHASVTCNIGEPKGEPPKYEVTLTVNIGGSVSVSGGTGQNEGSQSKGSAELKASKDRTMVVTHVLDETQLGSYTKALEQASKGSKVAATEKEFAVIAAVAKNDNDEAMRLFKEGGAIGKNTGDSLKHAGDSVKVTNTTAKGLSAKGESNGQGVGGGITVTDTESKEVKRNKDGGLDVVTDSEHATQKSLSGSMKTGVVGLSVGYQQEHKTSFGYSITIEQKDDPSGEVLADLGACKSEGDYEKFLVTHKGHYTFKAKTKGVADAVSRKTGLSLGGFDVAGMSEGHGIESKTKTDAKGNLIEKEVKGHGNIGGSFLGRADSKNDDAVAHIKGDDTASLDLITTIHDNHNDRSDEKKRKLLEEKMKGKGPASGLLAQATGGAEEPDTATHDVSGLTLSNKDLKRIGESVCRSPQAFVGWHRRADEVNDMKVAAVAIVKGKGTAAATAEALARFIGGDSVERLETVRRIVRGRNAQPIHGSGFEFPDSIASLQEDYAEVTDPELRAKVQAIGDKSQADGLKECVRLLKMIDGLSSAISACKDYRNPDLRAEMLVKLNLVRPPIAAGVKGFAHKPDAPDPKELEATGKRLIGQCTSFFSDKEELNGKLARLKGDYPRFRATDMGDARDLIKKLDDLVYRWRSAWMLLRENYKARNMPQEAADIYMVKPDEEAIPRWEKACGD